MKNHLGSIILGVSIICGVYLLGNAYQKRGKNSDSISVLGLGEENFLSDLIVWKASFSNKKNGLKEAYSGLRDDRNTIKKYFLSKGISETDIVFLAIEINKNYSYEYDDNGN
ncbi:MAG: SIMPL domain-containing protein, partial [Bacteroidetes bacterium]|nr:SIMPL domain-containing protein [Bacteroidota bacterium]